MEGLFFHLLNISINAGWLVLAVLLLRLLLKKAPTWMRVALWGLVGLRLILPFSIESIFSLIPSAETVPPTIVYDREPAIQSGIPAINNIVNPIIGESFAPAPTASANPLQIWGFIASAVWLIGLILMISYMLFGYLRLRLRLRTATKREDGVYESECVFSPFILGTFRPRIYLPYGLDEQTLPYVIAHERAHLKRRDHLLKPLAFLLLAVYWFQPLLWLAYIMLCRDIEYACDEKVIKNESEETRRAYSRALLSCSVSRRTLTACPLAFGEVGVKGRIKNVMNYKKPAFWLIIFAAVALTVIAVCFLTDPVSNEPFSTEDLPRYFEAVELILDPDGYGSSHDTYYYIDKNMNLYQMEPFLRSFSGAEWQFVGTLQKEESSEEGVEAWKVNGVKLHGRQSYYVFYFHENGEVHFDFRLSGQGLLRYRMKAVNKMTRQLNVISIKSLREDIGISHHETEISYNETKSDPYGNIRLSLWVDNGTDHTLVHKGHVLYVDENGSYQVRSKGDVRLEKKTMFGWKEIDYINTETWKNYGSKNNVNFILDDDILEKGTYRMTFFADLVQKSSDFSSEETVEYVEKDVPCGEVIFEIVDPNETLLKAQDFG